MFQKQILSFEDTKTLNPLVLDYLLKKKETDHLYTFYPDAEGYKELLQDKNLFSSLNRKVLVQSLTEQAKAVKNTGCLLYTSFYWRLSPSSQG